MYTEQRFMTDDLQKCLMQALFDFEEDIINAVID